MKQRLIVLTGVAVAVSLALAGGAFSQGPWKAPAETKKLKNPLKKSEAVEKAGKNLYTINCVACHGPNGKGDGPAAASLPVKPKNLSDKSVLGETEGESFWKITNGRGPMPAWKHLSDNDRWGLVMYIREEIGKKN